MIERFYSGNLSVPVLHPNYLVFMNHLTVKKIVFLRNNSSLVMKIPKMMIKMMMKARSVASRASQRADIRNVNLVILYHLQSILSTSWSEITLTKTSHHVICV